MLLLNNARLDEKLRDAGVAVAADDDDVVVLLVIVTVAVFYLQFRITSH
jgi:hypothetical protein